MGVREKFNGMPGWFRYGVKTGIIYAVITIISLFLTHNCASNAGLEFAFGCFVFLTPIFPIFYLSTFVEFPPVSPVRFLNDLSMIFIAFIIAFLFGTLLYFIKEGIKRGVKRVFG